MEINIGKINLLKLFEELEKAIDFEFEKRLLKNLISQDKFSKKIYDDFLRRPIIIYIKENTLPVSSNINNNILQYIKNAIGVERNFELFYFKKLKMDELELLEVNCILIESDYKDINSLNTLDSMIFLDYFIEKKVDKNLKPKNNTSGKINYQLIDEYFDLNYTDTDLKKLRKKAGEHKSQYFLELQLEKPNYKNIELEYFESPENINLSIYDLTKTIFNYRCPICNNKHKIKLHGYRKNNEVNVSSYIKPSGDSGINNQPKHFIFNCDHFKTKYFNINNSYAKVKNDFKYTCSLDNEQYNRLFLFIAARLKYFDDSKVKYIKKYNEKEDDIEKYNKEDIILNEKGTFLLEKYKKEDFISALKHLKNENNY